MGIDSIRKAKVATRSAKWVKNYEDSIREIALLLFFLTLFVGMIWMTGKDVEPITFVLGSICTLLYASPTLARYILPDAKPVKDMGYDEILDFVTRSDAKLDWKWIATNLKEEAFLKEDPRLRISVSYDKEGMQQEEITESWVSVFAESTATSYWFDLSYDHALIDRFILVSVEGGKAELPMPEPGTLQVDPLNYKVAQIFDEHNTLDEYMNRADINIKKDIK